ncbi:hypothetical protein AQI88_27800 [Streptomyces cellostaticus]|uniref:Phage baseplate protein n=1 Tax=Streptomyces cellostaticus TaxID=67285 RepID=A0A124HC36_9ACTN|nr:hypothetical protein [Streptomyces cellostaticus]KUM93186.1 hypothetical protein AQI88_27800 [Streptomyces cellostaticus]GHI09568.1 hypothetical protein Scel_78890 [Streptomyces cellostaticus]
MAITGAAGLLDAWEAGLAEAPAGRALLLHGTARPDLDAAALPAVPLGERESDLFALRRALFGERMQVRLECRTCGADMEFELDAGQFARSLGGSEETAVRLTQDGWDITFRLPAAADLTAAARAADPRAALLARCLVSAAHDGTPKAADALPAPVQQRIAEAVKAADPGADVMLTIGCPECGTATRAELDIASYLWTELDAWARDLLLDVHLLATAYGWSEPEILALSPLRRRYYLELCADV